MDFVMMYVISHAMMKKYINVEWPHVVLCMIYTIVLAPVLYFFDGYIFRVVSIPILLGAIKLIIRRINFNDIIMIYMISLLIIGVAQIPILGGFWLVNYLFVVYDSVLLFLSQVISTVVVILICQKFYWYKWFDAVQSHHILKLIVCLVALIILIPMAIINFDYNISYFLLLTLAFVLGGALLVPIFIKLYRDVVDVISIRDFKSTLFGMWLDMKDEKDIENFKRNFSETVNEFGLALPQFKSEVCQTSMERDENNKCEKI